MCVSFMKQLGVRWLVTSLNLICAMAVTMGTASAEDAAPDATGGPNGPPCAGRVAHDPAFPVSSPRPVPTSGRPGGAPCLPDGRGLDVERGAEVTG